MKYHELIENQRNKINNFDIKFAFNKSQFQEMLEFFKDDKIVSIGSGGYIRKNDVEKFENMIKENETEKKSFLSIEENLINAIESELGNYEYCITYDETETVNSLDLDLENNELHKKCFKIARKNYLEFALA